MKTIVLIFFLLISCSEESVKPALPIGRWEGRNWYCNNPSVCLIIPEDAAATFNFEILEEKGKLKATDGVWFKPSCSPPNCGTTLWVVERVSYSEGSLYIKWIHGYEFTGGFKNGKFEGAVYQIQSGKVIWNENIQIFKIGN